MANENKIRILYVQPGKYPEERVIEHTLAAMQTLVGGDIEAVYPWEDNAGVVCDGEGKLKQKPLNRLLEDYDVLSGSFFVCGLGEDDFTSLTDEQFRHYEKLFRDPEPVTEYILHITVSSKSVDALADLYRFTQDQRDILHQLLSEEMRPSLLALCGGIAAADGTLCWPLPGHTYISCHFGEVDAFGNAGHRGTDIPAPEGTPILAAHSGTVLVSGWNDSYGNQVLLDNGAGLSTRYAHMTQTAVTAGEAVTAGQVIGYVGSTGDSTGNHLHFEVSVGGVLTDPLGYVKVS